MLVFGPYRAIPQGQGFTVFNFTSMTQDVPRLPGLLIDFQTPIYDEYQFDLWYYNYILDNVLPFSSLMKIMISLYETGRVYVCINDYTSDYFTSLLNESLMKMIQQRYGVMCNVINNPEDIDYIQKDGPEFQTKEGIDAFDHDKEQYILNQTESGLLGISQ